MCFYYFIKIYKLWIGCCGVYFSEHGGQPSHSSHTMSMHYAGHLTTLFMGGKVALWLGQYTWSMPGWLVPKVMSLTHWIWVCSRDTLLTSEALWWAWFWLQSHLDCLIMWFCWLQCCQPANTVLCLIWGRWYVVCKEKWYSRRSLSPW